MTFPQLNKGLNFSLTGEKSAAARQFALEKLKPTAHQRDLEGRFPTEELAQLASQGFFSLCVPQELGGGGLSYREYAQVLRELSAGCTSTCVTISVTNMVALTLAKHATAQLADELKERFRSCENFLLSFAITEPESGSDAGSIQTTYKHTQGGYVLKGHKCFISSGAHCDAVATTARDEADPTKISFFYLPAQTEGLRIGKGESKMGLRSSNTVQLFYDHIELPKSCLLGDEGVGFKIALTALNGGRVGIASQALGIGLAAYQELVQWSKTHKIGQVNRWKIADMATTLEAGMLLIDDAARGLDEGRPSPKAASMAKLYCTEECNKIVATALDIVGHDGYMADSPLQRHFRDCRVTTLYEGTSEIQRLVIARQLLKHGMEGQL